MHTEGKNKNVKRLIINYDGMFGIFDCFEKNLKLNSPFQGCLNAGSNNTHVDYKRYLFKYRKKEKRCISKFKKISLGLFSIVFQIIFHLKKNENNLESKIPEI